MIPYDKCSKCNGKGQWTNGAYMVTKCSLCGGAGIIKPVCEANQDRMYKQRQIKALENEMKELESKVEEIDNAVDKIVDKVEDVVENVDVVPDVVENVVSDVDDKAFDELKKELSKMSTTELKAKKKRGRPRKTKKAYA